MDRTKKTILTNECLRLHKKTNRRTAGLPDLFKNYSKVIYNRLTLFPFLCGEDSGFSVNFVGLIRNT